MSNALPPRAAKVAGDAFDRFLNVQRPVVLAHLRSIRARRPNATPEQVLRPDVRRHDHHRIAEVDRAALAVGEPPVVEHLEQHVEHVRVRLLDFVE